MPGVVASVAESKGQSQSRPGTASAGPRTIRSGAAERGTDTTGSYTCSAGCPFLKEVAVGEAERVTAGEAAVVDAAAAAAAAVVAGPPVVVMMGIEPGERDPD